MVGQNRSWRGEYPLVILSASEESYAMGNENSSLALRMTNIGSDGKTGCNDNI